jgi:hypothetical protein
VELLDNTLLSNFVHVNRLDLVAIALPEASTTPQVLTELNEGETSGRLSPSDWSWLNIVSLSPEEMAHFEQLRLILDDGEPPVWQ